MQTAKTPTEVARELERVLELPELSNEKSLIEQLFDWLSELFGWSGDPAAFAEAFVWLLVALAGVVLGVAVWKLRHSFRRRGGVRGGGAAEAAVAARVAELRAKAREARAAGDERLALRLSLFALVVGLGERGNLRYRDSWTLRELIERGRPSAEARALLLELVRELEPKEFGREPVRAADLDRLEALCDEWLGRLAGGRAA